MKTATKPVKLKSRSRKKEQHLQGRNVTMAPPQIAALEVLRARSGRSISEIVRQAVDEYLHKYAADVLADIHAHREDGR